MHAIPVALCGCSPVINHALLPAGRPAGDRGGEGTRCGIGSPGGSAAYHWRLDTRWQRDSGG